MKYYTNFAIILTLLCLLLTRGISSGTLTEQSSQLISPTAASLSHLFQVSEVKEPIYLILIEKNKQRLRVLEYDTELRVVADYPCATGENLGIKEISGDSKTPEGVYFITKVFIDDEVTIFGDKAFHLDYPNIFDQKAGRNGDGIYIHGTNRELQPNSTNGCVTLANSDLDDLEKYLNQIVTPVVIVQELASIRRTDTALLTENDFTLAKSLLLKEEIKPDNVEYNYLYIINFGRQGVAVSDFIYRPFNGSLMQGASRTYLEYQPVQGWSASKRFWRTSPLQIYPEVPVKVAVHPLVADEVLLAEQTPTEAPTMIAALEPQDVRIPAVKETSQSKKQDVTTSAPKVLPKPHAHKGNQLKKEVQQTAAVSPTITPPSASSRTETAKKVMQSEKIKPSPPAVVQDKQQIIEFVENWRQAWVSKKIEPYIALYDDSFTSGGKNLTEWKDHKTKLNKTYSFIAVDISDIKVQWNAAGATVTFRQEYRSDLYNATGSKTLILIYNERGWKIKREVFSRS